ncbi:MAG: sugar ABC transporter substrate-binding protein [Lachnospiraceae bacterium]|nr:sugar ABC transporter substrate-binding protein [Lachnospiraceae bacterium]
MKKAKITSMLLALTMAVGLLAGCQKSTPETPARDNPAAETKDQQSVESQGENVTLSFYTWWADAEQAMSNALIESFEKEHPNIHIEATYIAESDYLSKINTLIAANSMPDVYFINEYLVNDWGVSGHSADLNPYLNELGINADEIWVDTALYKSNDALYGINYGATTVVLYYNKEMMAEAGITPPSTDGSKAWTWEEYLDAAIKMTKDVNGKSPSDDGFDYDSCTQFGTTMASTWIYWLPELYASGAAIADDAGENLTITSPEAISAIQNIADLSNVHQCAPTVGMTDSAFSDASAMLMNGQLGMFIGGNFLLGNFEAESFDVGIAQIPTQNGAAPSNMVWSSAFSMSAKTQHPKEAAEFLAYMANFDNSVKTARESGVPLNTLPNTKNTLDESTEAYKEWEETYHAGMAETSGGILASASRKGENVTLKNFSILMNVDLIPALDGVWIGEKTAEEALTALEEQLKKDFQGAW